VTLLEQLGQLIAGKASALDDPPRQPTAQVAAVPGHNHAAAVTGTPQNNVAARLMVYLEASALQSPDDLTRLYSGQTGITLAPGSRPDVR
jgi:hypothetical protein